MKVTGVETLSASVYQWVKVTTDDDIYGVGELHPASGTDGSTYAVRGAVENCAEYLLGKDPLQIERHWQHMFRRCLFRGGSDAMGPQSAQ